jgi:peptidoglycan/LPS O-acetylase OafA/YrhL
LPSFLSVPVSRERAEGIDAIRAACALWVLFGHLFPWSLFAAPDDHAPIAKLGAASMSAFARLFQPFAETNPAVLIFIVLSGYCIHRNGLRSDDADFRTYARKRAFRIVPVYVAAALAGFLCHFTAVGIDPKVGMALTGTREITAFGVFLKFTGLPALVPSWHVASFQGNAPLNTVMVEIWLYAVYAIVLAIAIRTGTVKWIAAFVGCAWCAGLVAVSRNPEWVGWWHNGSLVGFLAPWWIGAMAVSYKVRSREFIVFGMVAWLALTVAVNLTSSPALLLVELRKLAFCVACAGLVVASDRRLGGIFLPAAFVGRAGYSIYAFHAPLLVIMLVLGIPWWLAAALVIAFGVLAHLFFEKPMDLVGRRQQPY